MADRIGRRSGGELELETRAREDMDDECQQQLQWANEVLDNEDPSEVWKVGKMMKKLVEMDENQEKMTPETLSNVYFVWGSALARLAAADNDVTLATAAIDKFEHVERLSSRAEVGATGMVLWASCKLIVAMENHDLPEIHRAIQQLRATSDGQPKG